MTSVAGIAGVATATGARLLVPHRELHQTGAQFTTQAPQIEDQVLTPLQATEQTHGMLWTGGAREGYTGLHRGMVQSLQYISTRTSTLGKQLAQQANYFAVLAAFRLGAAPDVGAPGPVETEWVTGTKPLSQADIKNLIDQHPNGVRKEALTAADRPFVREAESYRDQAQTITNYPRKCWAVDESGGPAILDPLSDDEKEVPSGYASDRPYGQYSEQVKHYADNQLGPYGYHLTPHAGNDRWFPGPDQAGIADASHAEKQASMRGDLSKRVGVNRPQCRSCREYYQAMAQQRGVPQYVADTDMTRIYYPNGEVGIVLQEGGQDVVYIFDKQWATKNLYNPDRRLP